MTVRTSKPAAALLVAMLLAPLPGRAANTPPEIVEPQDTDAVPAMFSVVVEPGTYNYCDTDGCFEQIPEGIGVLADDMSAGWASPDSGGPVTVDVTLEPGMHTLVAQSDAFLGPVQESAPVVVLVETTGGETETESDTDAATETGTAGTDADTDSGGASPVDEEGCACAVGEGRGAPWWAVFGVGALVLGRRRR